jgi:ribonuclease PH
LAKRRTDILRPVRIQTRFTEVDGGSVLIAAGQTHVLCTAMWVEGAPRFREKSGGGWLTAEYRMLPSSTPERKPRESRVDGRSQEIQRLIGRSLRACVDLDAIGPWTIHVDCDVLQADGGTRTAAITGGFVALYEAIRWARKQKIVRVSPIIRQVAAVSVGIVGRRTVVDLDYELDSGADVDFNVVMTDRAEFIEVQGCAEGAPFSRPALDKMLNLARRGIKLLHEHQRKALRIRKI